MPKILSQPIFLEIEELSFRTQDMLEHPAEHFTVDLKKENTYNV